MSNNPFPNNNSDKTLLNLEKKIDSIQDKLDRINAFLNENRSLYVDIIKQNQDMTQKIQHMTQKIIETLEENRSIYLKAINSVENKEDENLKAIKPLLENVKEQSDFLTKKMSSPFLKDRIHYRYWRSHYLPDSDSPRGCPEILDESPIVQHLSKNIPSQNSHPDKLSYQRRV
jgi:hypothetical protein